MPPGSCGGGHDALGQPEGELSRQSVHGEFLAHAQGRARSGRQDRGAPRSLFPYRRLLQFTPIAARDRLRIRGRHALHDGLNLSIDPGAGSRSSRLGGSTRGRAEFLLTGVHPPQARQVGATPGPRRDIDRRSPGVTRPVSERPSLCENSLAGPGWKAGDGVGVTRVRLVVRLEKQSRASARDRAPASDGRRPRRSSA